MPGVFTLAIGSEIFREAALTRAREPNLYKAKLLAKTAMLAHAAQRARGVPRWVPIAGGESNIFITKP
jgi:hypothetical protein